MRKYYHKKRKSIELSKKGELVMLNRKIIHTKHLNEKGKDMMYGSFEVIASAKNGKYCKVTLPDSSKIHPTINISR
jgi:hypothetical protein